METVLPPSKFFAKIFIYKQEMLGKYRVEISLNQFSGSRVLICTEYQHLGEITVQTYAVVISYMWKTGWSGVYLQAEV